MADDKLFVSYVCQRCLMPLVIDDSFNSLGEHVSAELSLPVHATPDVELESQATSFDNYVHPFRLSDSANGANGFMVLPEVEPRSNRMEVRATLFDTLSGNSNIDHPLCEECTDALTEMLEQEIKLTENDYLDYCKYLQKLQADTSEPKLGDLERELQDLKNEERQLMKKLTEMQAEEVVTIEAIKQQEKEEKRLAAEDAKYWIEYTRHRKDYMFMDDEYKSLECQREYMKSQLDKLTGTNVFNATFHIWHSGHFGTINNFRLGRLPTAPVDWSEINAAWGQTALLLSALARKINLKFDKYKLVPFGNHSYIEIIDEQKVLPLYGSGGFRFLWDTKFDSAMVAFLECLQQFKNKVTVEKGDKDFSLPYKMAKGKLEDSTTSYSIKIQLNSEEQWTKALKFMLTNLKWSLAWVTSQINSEDDSADV